ncbi:MAG: class I SAM-dependent methyltransferase [Candidatus Magasanikbacteria bacterium]|jgi:ubiquinone/menaquinone biosynthesis C-methylase UbiE|nr:class I SAM-dependent methyltransferase [Candidatus Magasanikbacteria bacterium]MBT4221312.1 class I SAM-dependent methyltransferase [Candidatus Magasanikbacteria bacterium]MBT4350840.1 class I SAM-dependent methyltransferase [Candidatus Magasanikbacteria bacterium]MBT4542160.1 class I SAM-dependent methyltransferase [Candidatus Magasanikbacteria bacterium]MBT6253436.1 class I SAM-dependent methyltransferase [Candidatus Magasanikbacteria bacterium]
MLLIIIDLLFLALLFVMVLFFVYNTVALKTGAPYVPTKKTTIDTMIKLSKPQKGEQVVDLGSGDGRMLFAVAKTGATCIGIEINPVLCFYANMKARIKGIENVHTKKENLWKTDLQHTNVLMLYFWPTKMDDLQKKIEKEMKPGSRVISHAFHFPNWKPEEKSGNVYLYIVK